METLTPEATSNSVTFQMAENPPEFCSLSFLLKQKMAEALRLDEGFPYSRVPENKGQEVTEDTSARSDHVKNAASL